MHIIHEDSISITNYDGAADREVIFANPSLPITINPPLASDEISRFERPFSTITQPYPTLRHLSSGATIIKMVNHTSQTLFPVPQGPQG